MLLDRIAAEGFVIVPDVAEADFCARLGNVFTSSTGDRAGSRAGLAHDDVRALASSPAVRALVEPVLGAAAFAVRATLFDKTVRANWLVAWHQDLVIPVLERREVPGFGPWSQKDGVPCVQAPAEVLGNLLAVRVDLDGSDARSGALRVLPGTHTLGVLSAKQRADFAWSRAPVTCAVPDGGALVMRPLLLHASSRAEMPSHRRVIHLEFAVGELPDGLRWHQRVR